MDNKCISNLPPVPARALHNGDDADGYSVTSCWHVSSPLLGQTLSTTSA